MIPDVEIAASCLENRWVPGRNVYTRRNYTGKRISYLRANEADVVRPAGIRKLKIENRIPL